MISKRTSLDQYSSKPYFHLISIAHGNMVGVWLDMKWPILALFAIFSLLTIQFVSTNEASAATSVKPQITAPDDIYVISKTPTTVSYSISAIDYTGKEIPVNCDHGTGHLFKTGKTTVRCYAVDSAGNEARTSFLVTVGYEIVKIPKWLKLTTGYWISNQISDSEYTKTLEFLMQNKIILVPFSNKSNELPNSEIPIWIKTNSQKWLDGNASDDEFSIGIQWMLERGLVKI